MKEESEKNELAPTGADYVTSAAKAALGAVPFAGSLLVEIAGTIIPNQRIDRIVAFAKDLDERLAALEQEFVRSQLSNEDFTDLVEEGLRQAARAVTEERKQYIASIIANSLSSEDIEYVESKHLLRILGELNDIEIVWLRFHTVQTMGGDKEYREKHQDILKPIAAVISAPQGVLDKSTLQGSYKEHLAELGLLERRYEMDTHGKDIRLKIKGYDLTRLGRLLVREVGLAKE
jgi:hypothetical protein